MLLDVCESTPEVRQLVRTGLARSARLAGPSGRKLKKLITNHQLPTLQRTLVDTQRKDILMLLVL